MRDSNRELLDGHDVWRMVEGERTECGADGVQVTLSTHWSFSLGKTIAEGSLKTKKIGKPVQYRCGKLKEGRYEATEQS